jgi:hypothetical protein
MTRTLGLLLLLGVALGGVAAAQDDDGTLTSPAGDTEAAEPAADVEPAEPADEAEPDEPVDTTHAPDRDGPSELDDEQAELEITAEVEAQRSTTDPFEEEDEDYFFLGAFGRVIFVPRFIQNVFIEDGVDATNPAAGLEFTYRRNQFNVIVNAWWANAAAEGFFRANGDPITDQEFVDVQLQAVFVSASLMWGIPLTDWLAFEVGVDIGIGAVFGDMYRTEAYVGSDGEFAPCAGPGDPGMGNSDTNGGCEEGPASVGPETPCVDGQGHYGCREPQWTDDPGGDVPIIFPWFALPRLALRIKPIRQLQIRIDGGYNLWGFFVGGSAAFGF